MHNFKDLRMWQKAIDLAVDVYNSMLQLPSDEKFGLISQMKRCTVSIPLNIAEGSGRGSNPKFKHFLKINQGSALELESHFIISNGLEILEDDLTEKLVKQTTEVKKMIYSLE